MSISYQRARDINKYITKWHIFCCFTYALNNTFSLLSWSFSFEMYLSKCNGNFTVTATKSYVEPMFDKYIITFPIHLLPKQYSSTWGCPIAIVYCVFFSSTQVTQSVCMCVQCPRSCIVKTRIQNIWWDLFVRYNSRETLKNAFHFRHNCLRCRYWWS